MDYIRLFDTAANYNSAKGNFRYPTVSYIDGNDEMRYMTEEDYNRYYYSTQYLTFEALESGTFTFTLGSYVTISQVTSISYSIDNGENWVTLTNYDHTSDVLLSITTPVINVGDKVLWKGISQGTFGNISSTEYRNSSYFSATGAFKVYGNLCSLLNEQFNEESLVTSFRRLFYECSTIVDAENLILPNTITPYAFGSMFYGCTSLTTPPALPATTLANYCYFAMFSGCTSLTTAPAILPATTLVENCYNSMFYGCTSLTTAPELPATTLATYCCKSMFFGCTALTTAPVLPATTLETGCYEFMFKDCSSLNYIKAMFTTTPTETRYTAGWVGGVAATGTFVKNSAAQWNVTGIYGVPSGWTVETASS